MTRQLGKPSTHYSIANSDRYFVQEASRIPERGTHVTRYRGLTILASQLGPDRNEDYIKNFEHGEATFYHTKFHAFERQRIEQHIATEAQYIAVSVDDDDKVFRRVEYIYPILKAERVKRKNLTEEQSGTTSMSNPEERFWLFTLGRSLKLKESLIQEWKEHFELKLVSRDDLSGGYSWDDLPELYSSVVKQPS